MVMVEDFSVNFQINQILIMKAFKNEEQKQELLTQLKYHQDLDAFVQGRWMGDKIEGNGFKGCFYGCTMQTEENPREKFSEQYQIDLWYCYLTESIFEGLPKGEFEKFPYKSIEIIPVGFDFNKVKSRFFWLMLEDQKKFSNGNKEVLDYIIQCQKLFEVDFDKINTWSAAESAESAESAARSASWSASWSARSASWSARSASWSASWSARSAARSAAWSARSAAWSAESASWSAYYVFLKDILFQSINESKQL
jgi:hypothetical protein